MPVSAYIGWKQPPSSAPSTKIASSRTTTARRSPHDIHDPLRNDNHFLRRLPLERPFYRIKRQNGSLNFAVGRSAADGQIGPFSAIDLHRQRHGVLYQEIAFDL